MRKRACVAARQAGREHTPRYTALPPLGPCQGTPARPPPRRSKACPASTPHTPRVCPTRLTSAAGDGCRARNAPRVAVCAQRALVRPMGHGTLARRLLQLKTAEARPRCAARSAPAAGARRAVWRAGAPFPTRPEPSPSPPQVRHTVAKPHTKRISIAHAQSSLQHTRRTLPGPAALAPCTK